MSTITTLKLWRDPGYTDGCMEVPSFGDSLPAADLTVTELNPSKDRLFSELRISEPYETVYDMCYLQADYEMNNGNNITLYGWVDSVSCQSDTEGYPMTVISWHVDMWRTFAPKAEFGSGMVKRRPVSGDMPPQSYPYRFRELDSSYAVDLVGSTDMWWFMINLNHIVGDGTVMNQVYAIPIVTSGYQRLYIKGGYRTVSLPDVIDGNWDELLQLNPENIKSAYLSPIAPQSASGSGTQSDPVTMSWPTVKLYDSMDTSFGVFYDSGDSFEEYSDALPSSVSTSDTETYIVMSLEGDPIGALPWGMSCRNYTYRMVNSAVAGYLQIRFDGIDSSAVGLTFTIPLPMVDVASNSWSSYVYSGARQADIDQRRLQAESQAVSGGISTATSTVNGALSGAIMGSMVAPGVGTVAGAAIGAATSAISGIISTSANYAYQTGAYADEAQRIEDYSHAMQSSSLIMSGTGFDTIFHGRKSIALIKIETDQYSQDVRQNDLNIYGCSVSEPRTSCQSLIEAGGPLQIQNLVVRGDIPSTAKQYLRERFSKGVRIV